MGMDNEKETYSVRDTIWRCGCYLSAASRWIVCVCVCVCVFHYVHGSGRIFIFLGKYFKIFMKNILLVYVSVSLFMGEHTRIFMVKICLVCVCV